MIKESEKKQYVSTLEEKKYSIFMTNSVCVYAYYVSTLYTKSISLTTTFQVQIKSHLKANTLENKNVCALDISSYTERQKKRITSSE